MHRRISCYTTDVNRVVIFVVGDTIDYPCKTNEQIDESQPYT